MTAPARVGGQGKHLSRASPPSNPDATSRQPVQDAAAGGNGLLEVADQMLGADKAVKVAAKSRFALNIFSNVTGYLVSAVVALFLSPLVVHSLGDEIYGIWTLVISLTGYYGLFDLGIRSAVNQYVTRYRAKGDMDGVNRTLNTAMVLMCGVAGFGTIATAILAIELPRWVNLAPADMAVARSAMIVVGAGIVTTFPMAIYSTVLSACERFDLQNAIGILERLISAAFTVWILRSGYGILGLAAVTTGVGILGWVVRIRVAYALMPELRFSPRLFSRAAVREVFSYGVFAFMINAAGRVLIYADAVIIAIFLTARAITYYSVGSNLVPYYMSLITALTWTFTPYATSCDARGDYHSLRQLYLNGTRVTVVLAAIVGGGMILLGHDFLKLWMGERFVSGDVYTSSAVILTVLTCATLVQSVQDCGLQILFAMRRQRFLAIVFIGEAVANVILSSLLVHSMGILGVALGTLVPLMFTRGVVLTRYLLRVLDVRLGSYLTHVGIAGFAVLLPMVGMYRFVNLAMPVGSWQMLLAKGCVVTAPALVGAALFAVTREERRSIVARLLPQYGRVAK